MTWDAIAAVSELVAAIAVVITLIYIALQVRSGASAFKTNLRDSTFRSLMEINYAVTADESGAWVFQQGASDWDLLEDREQARALQMMYSFFKMFKNMYLHYLDGLVEEKMWASNRQVLFAYAAQPGAQRNNRPLMAIYGYLHVAHEAGYEMSRWPLVETWLSRVAEQPRHFKDLAPHPENARIGAGRSSYN